MNEIFSEAEKASMDNVIMFPGETKPAPAEPSDVERRLAQRFGISQSELRMAIKPLFMLMYDHGVSNLSIARDGAKAIISVDGKPI